MPTKFGRTRLKPFVLCALATGIVGIANAQTSNPPNDAGFRANVPSTAVTPVKGQPGGVVTLYSPNAGQNASNRTRTPIKHVILLIGENRTFDHVFATYTPPRGQSVENLLSEGIVKADGTAGPNVSKAQQWQASDTGAYSVSPTHTSAYANLPSMNTGGAPTQPYLPSTAAAESIEPALPTAYYPFLAEGGTGLPNDVVDTRFPATLPNAPVSMHASISYNDYANSPVHRFFQMWQQLDCNVNHATRANPSGCRADLFPWVEVTMGAGNNGVTQPAGFTDQSTGEGSTSMQFLNMAQGDAPYFKQLAEQYALSDNFHQSVMGGTGANHIMLGFGDLIYYANANGDPTTPPENQIENPNAQTGTNNWWVQDGYSGGSYVNCADDTQPGVASVRSYLKSLPYHTFRGTDCKAGAYYLVNNYNQIGRAHV